MQAATVLAGDQDFTLHNKTGVEIHEVYVSKHSADNWEEDILGKDTLPSGEEVTITFDSGDKTPLWDIMVKDAGGNSITWENLKLTEVTDVTLYYKDGEATATTKNGE